MSRRKDQERDHDRADNRPRDNTRKDDFSESYRPTRDELDDSDPPSDGSGVPDSDGDN